MIGLLSDLGHLQFVSNAFLNLQQNEGHHHLHRHGMKLNHHFQIVDHHFQLGDHHFQLVDHHLYFWMHQMYLLVVELSFQK